MLTNYLFFDILRRVSFCTFLSLLGGIMKKIFLFLVAVLFLTPLLYAVNIEWVTISDVGNSSDNTGYGSVAYEYQIGTYEVTASQYTEFLNAVAVDDDIHGLYNSSMNSFDGCGIIQKKIKGGYTYYITSGWENRPVNYVSWSDALRFANWVHNGATSNSDTEDGAYNMLLPDGEKVRTLDALVFLPSEDEWYKAAYFDPQKQGGAGYYDYPTRSDKAPVSIAPPGGENSANYDGVVDSTVDVGGYKESGSAYGTFDQGGNIHEWTETIMYSVFPIFRGGSYKNAWPALYVKLQEYDRNNGEYSSIGFRVGSLSAYGH